MVVVAVQGAPLVILAGSLQRRASTTSSSYLAIAFGQERTPKTPKTRIRGSSHRIRGCGHPSIFRAHISVDPQIASDDPKALLVFSEYGSPRRQRAIKKLPVTFGYRGYTSPLSATSEGEAYLRFARATGLLPPADRFTRAATEGASLGLVPKPRFEQLHRRALRWPKLHFTYVGIPLGTEADERQALTNAFTPYSTDMYGCHAPLVQKRAGQNFHAKAHGYHVGAPEMRELLEWSEGWHADLSWYASVGEGQLRVPFLQDGTLRTHTSFEPVLSQVRYK
ncbi:hypothetical protein EDB85DRAFT_2291573 [Lactarius pseudohatsudake]|nr:hypothetical protein EDB85DRAFT_2291573 [Lactarius pseudohatsudake]